MEGVQTVDVSWLHHSQKGKLLAPSCAPRSGILYEPSSVRRRTSEALLIGGFGQHLTDPHSRSSFPYEISIISLKRQGCRRKGGARHFIQTTSTITIE